MLVELVAMRVQKGLGDSVPTAKVGFLQYLKKSKVFLSELIIESSKVAYIQNQLEKLFSKNYYLNQVRQIFGSIGQFLVTASY